MSTILVEPPIIAPEPARYTAEDLLTMPDGDDYELVDGQLVERTMGIESVWVGGRVYRLLSDYSDAHSSGWTLTEGASFQIFKDDPNRTRRADASVIRRGRLPGEKLPKGHCRVTPDLVAEVVSPNDNSYELNEKILDWRSAGVMLIWVIDPENQTVTVYRHATSQVTLLTGDDEITGEDVLPGFRCSIRDFFPPDDGEST